MCSAATHLVPEKCLGPNGGMFAASVNNITFRRPTVSLLNAYFNDLEGYYTMDFPDKPEKMYDFVNEAPNDMGVDTQPAIGTRVSVLQYGWSVQVIFQDTGTVGTENHPVHLHGFSFYVLGSGIGNFNPRTAVLNLYDPPYRNTIGVPVGGWAVIRFRADNPGYLITLTCLEMDLLYRSMVHALPSRRAHDMGAFYGFSCEEWRRQNENSATSTT
ncbi:hypothetical protein L1049_025317 [Liquidambar formosana]|uniref:Plastocyanin-like domain-containing protein n=1 Tax=Liquidambar formosana TaxID=63359 RepID=A0AAP0R2L8_LIQFO